MLGRIKKKNIHKNSRTLKTVVLIWLTVFVLHAPLLGLDQVPQGERRVAVAGSVDGGGIPLSAPTPTAPPIRYKIIQATVTAYSPTETCPQGLYEKCINAKGKRPMEGYSIACPRAIPFNTKVLLENRIFRCDDRTHERLDGNFDVFKKSFQDAIGYGKKRIPVTLLYEPAQK